MRYSFRRRSTAMISDVAHDSLHPIRFRAALIGAAGLALTLVARPGTVQALTIRVPADQPTIQAGLDAAAAGDTVLVAAGTYTGPGNQDLDFAGQDLVLLSESGAEATILDLDGSSSEPRHGFVFDQGESSAARVEGFTITDSYGGGGVFTGASSPTIIRCTFAQNDGGDGGGANIDGASPIFEDCIFFQNTPALGGGAFIRNSQATFLRCLFDGNGTDSGGGVWVAQQSQLAFTDCVFERNSVGALGDVWGGGISAEGGATITLEGCRFIDNSAFSADDKNSWGGAVYISGSTLVARNCTFERNRAARGGAIYVDGSADLTGCVLRGNQARIGGAVAAVAGAVPSLSECTLFDNEGTAGASGIDVEPGSGAAVAQVIIAFGRGGEAIACTGGVTVSCSDFFGNEGGNWVGCTSGQLGATGNISADPLFCHTDFGDLTIADSSPCAPAQSECGRIGALGVECQTSIEPATWGGIKAVFSGRSR